jgi:hypothetical protein
VAGGDEDSVELVEVAYGEDELEAEMIRGGGGVLESEGIPSILGAPRTRGVLVEAGPGRGRRPQIYFWLLAGLAVAFGIFLLWRL